MRSLKLLLFFLIVFSIETKSYAQTGVNESYKFPGENAYSKGMIYLRNNSRFQVTDLKIVNDRVSFIQKNTSSVSEFNLEDIQIIKVSQGTRAGEYALYGGLVFGLSAVLAIAQVKSDPYYDEDAINEPAFIGGFTAGGALIGGLVGSTKAKWKTLYVNEKISLLRYLVPDAFSIVVDDDYYAFNFVLSY